MYNIIVSSRHFFKRECSGIVCCFFKIPIMVLLINLKQWFFQESELIVNLQSTKVFD